MIAVFNSNDYANTDAFEIGVSDFMKRVKVLSVNPVFNDDTLLIVVHYKE